MLKSMLSKEKIFKISKWFGAGLLLLLSIAIAISDLSAFFAFLSFLVLILLITALIKPTIYKLKSRKIALSIFGGVFIVLFIIALILPSEKRDSLKKAQQPFSTINQVTESSSSHASTDSSSNSIVSIGETAFLRVGNNDPEQVIFLAPTPEIWDEVFKAFQVKDKVLRVNELLLLIPKGVFAVSNGTKVLVLDKKGVFSPLYRVRIIEGVRSIDDDKIGRSGWLPREFVTDKPLPSPTSSSPKSKPMSFSNSQPKTQNLKSETQDKKVLEAISASFASYKTPVQSGKWRTCAAERINALSNLQLLSFYEWLRSLSPHSAEITILTAISRKLGCPEPIERTIPAVTETIKSFSGVGSQTLGEVSISDSIEKKDWVLVLSWTNSPLHETFGVGTTGISREEIEMRKASWDYGIVNYDENATITGTPYIIGFYSPSGSNSESGESLLGGNIIRPNRFEYLRVKAPDGAAWEVKIERIIEPARTIVE